MSVRWGYGWSLLVCGLGLCGFGRWAWQDTVRIRRQEQAAAHYQSGFSLRRLPEGWNSDFGLHQLTRTSQLHGTICWAGHRNHELDVQEYPFQSVVIQRALLQPNYEPLVQNLSFPPHDTKQIDFVGQPIFSGNRGSGFLRASLLGEDYAQYRLLQTDFITLEAKAKEDVLLYGDQYLPSPDGRKYAYDGANPRDDSNSFLDVQSARGTQTIAQDTHAEGFSWTRDNHLLYTDYNPHGKVAKYHYPNIYENDLNGGVKLIKEGGYRPQLNATKTWVSYVGADTTPPKAEQTHRDLEFVFPDSCQTCRMALFAYDIKAKREYFIKSTEERYSKCLWINDKLYVIENEYLYDKRSAVCRIFVFDARSKSTRRLCTLTQKGDSSDLQDLKFTPCFDVVNVANSRLLLLQVPVKQSGEDNYHLVAVDVQDGQRCDLFSFSAPVNPYFAGTPYIAWHDAA